MGSLYSFERDCKSLKRILEDKNTSIFVETGCFRGDSLQYVMDGYSFDEVYSCDIDEEMIAICNNRFAHHRRYSTLGIFHEDSLHFLSTLLPTLKHVPSILFFLDAHLPEHDKNDGNVILESSYNFPLQEELNIIADSRRNRDDIIVCDDLRIYKDGPFQGGNWSERLKYNPQLHIPKMFKSQEFYSQEGYLLLTKNDI